MSVTYNLVGNAEDGSVITVYVKGQPPQVARDDHRNFERIVEMARNGDESVVDLFDESVAAATRFESLTERVSVANGRLYFDGDEIHGSLAKQVVRYLDAGIDDWLPLVNFYDNVMQNPNEHSREQLYNWLEPRDFTITADGFIVAYKGVRRTEDGKFESINRGTAVVDDVVHTGAIPNHPSSVVSMPRSEVAFDPSEGCSVGLHVGTYEFANSFAQGGLLEVHVNPRDVVSVPTDSDAQKMRVCRYYVVDIIEAPHTQPVRYDDEPYDDIESEDVCEDCGYEFDDYDDCECSRS